MAAPIERWRASSPGRSHTVAHGELVWTVANARTAGAALTVQIEETLALLDNSLQQAGSSRGRLLSTQVLLADIGDREQFNEAWCAWIGPDPAHWPQRAVHGAALAPGLLIEIIAVAARG